MKYLRLIESIQVKSIKNCVYKTDILSIIAVVNSVLKGCIQ